MADRYCTECGRPLAPEDKFCPGCGATVQEWDDYAPATAQAEKKEREKPTGTLVPIMIMTLVWAVFALAVGAYLYLEADTLVQAVKDALMQQPYEGYANMWEYVVSQGITEQNLKDGFVLIGLSFIVSGAAALGSAILMGVKKLYILALILLIVSAVSAITGILPLIIGLLMAYLLSKHKYEFDGVE